MYVFTPKLVRSPICHVLLDVQNTHRRALIHRQQASTDINLLSLIRPKRCYIQTNPTSFFLCCGKAVVIIFFICEI